MSEYSTQLLQLLERRSILQRGTFTLKSGRTSSYFFDFGRLYRGADIADLGRIYAEFVVSNWPLQAVDQAGSEQQIDVLFGPAYKGISLAVSCALALSQQGYDLDTAYNRKERKQHGEGGVCVGAPLNQRSVLILDDVLTAGTAVREAVSLVRSMGAKVAGVLVALDRCEPAVQGGDASLTAAESLRTELGIRIESIAKAKDWGLH